MLLSWRKGAMVAWCSFNLEAFGLSLIASQGASSIHHLPNHPHRSRSSWRKKNYTEKTNLLAPPKTTVTKNLIGWRKVHLVINVAADLHFSLVHIVQSSVDIGHICLISPRTIAIASSSSNMFIYSEVKFDLKRSCKIFCLTFECWWVKSVWCVIFVVWM